jgi:hypothetical protein
MSKYNTLLSKLEAFEKIAKFGDRASFLQSLAQENVDVSAKLKDAANSLYKSILNWVNTSGEKQSDVPGKPAGLPAAMRSPVQVLLSTIKNNSYDLDTLPALNGAVKQIMNVSNLGNMGQAASDAWYKSVFPQANYVADLIGAQMNFLNAWRAKNESFMDSEAPAETKPVETAPVAAPAKKSAPSVKNLSSALINKVNKLSEGPERINQLKEIDRGVKTLQDYFRRLQNNNSTNAYLAKVDIVNALKKVYQPLDFKDLQTVVSFGPNFSGVPETPEAKI